jgi:putative Mg2+ transporter-C (MgtC) family protein
MSLSALVGTDLAPHAWKFLIAFALGLPTGWERYQHDRSAGLRTFPLVSLASCAYMLVAAQQTLDVASQARILVGVITGIGFIGGGSIIKEASGDVDCRSEAREEPRCISAWMSPIARLKRSSLTGMR